MSCFINDFQQLMKKYNIIGIDFTGNIDNEGKLHIDTYRPLYKESTTNFVPHEPDEDELRQMFI
jgi:hypothetical protein